MLSDTIQIRILDWFLNRLYVGSIMSMHVMFLYIILVSIRAYCHRACPHVPCPQHTFHLASFKRLSAVHSREWLWATCYNSVYIIVEGRIIWWDSSQKTVSGEFAKRVSSNRGGSHHMTRRSTHLINAPVLQHNRVGLTESPTCPIKPHTGAMTMYTQFYKTNSQLQCECWPLTQQSNQLECL